MQRVRKGLIIAIGAALLGSVPSAAAFPVHAEPVPLPAHAQPFAPRETTPETGAATRAEGEAAQPAPAVQAAEPKLAGAAASWGENYFGQLGAIYKDTWESSPVGVEGLSNIDELAVTGTFNLARLADGSIVSWGGNASGELGDDRRLPSWQEGVSHVAVAEEDPVTHEPSGPLHGVRALAAANEHAMALLSGGTVVAWGSDVYGQLGDGKQGFERLININERLPKPVPGLSGIRAIAAGGGSDYAVTAQNTVLAWGENTAGQLGLGEPGPDHCETGTAHYPGYEACSVIPRPVVWTNPANGHREPLGEVQQVVAGQFAAYALLRSGRVVSWGSNLKGELGTGVDTWRSAVEYPPTEVQRAAGYPLTGVVELAAGYDAVIARLANGEVVGWGSAAQGQLASATAEDCRRESLTQKQEEAGKTVEPRPCVKYATPLVAVEQLHPSQLAMGHHYGLALAGSDVYSWGTNEFGQLGIGKEPWGRNRPEGAPVVREPGNPVPARVKGIGPAAAVYAGSVHAVALLKPGTAAPPPLVSVAPGPLSLGVSWRDTGREALKGERLLYRVADPTGEREPAEQGHTESEEGPPLSLEPEPPYLTLEGEPLEGQPLVPKDRLYGEPGAWTGARPITFTYQWQRCNAQGEACATIAGSKGPGYRLAPQDIGSTIRVLITASGPGGTSTAASQPTETVTATEQGGGGSGPATSVKLPPGADPFAITRTVEKIETPGRPAREVGHPLQPVAYEVRFRASGRSRAFVATPFGYAPGAPTAPGSASAPSPQTESGPTAATDVLPVSASATSMSARTVASIRRTAASPPPATAHAHARPRRTARAPRASIFTTSRPERTPPSTRTSTSPRTAAAIPGSARTVEGTESSCRPPWLETTIPSTPAAAARRASSGSSTPLTSSLPSQCSRTHAMSSQVTDGSNCASTHSRKASGVLAPGTARSRFPKVKGLPPRPTSRTQRGCDTRSSPRLARTQAEPPPPSPLRVSRCRAPTTARSIVSTSTGEPTACARAISSSA